MVADPGSRDVWLRTDSAVPTVLPIPARGAFRPGEPHEHWHDTRRPPARAQGRDFWQRSDRRRRATATTHRTSQPLDLGGRPRPLFAVPLTHPSTHRAPMDNTFPAPPPPPS